SYGFLGRDGVKLKPLISYQGVWALSTGGVTVPGGGEATQLLNVVIAEGGPEALRRTLRRHLGETEPTAVTGSILDPAKAPVVGARVHVRSDDSKTYITMTRSDAKGHYAVNLPPGAYRLTVVADGRLPTKETTIQAAKTEVIQDLNVDGTATVTFTVADTDGSPLPAKLIFMPKNKPTALPKSFGEATFPGGAARVLFHLPGEEKTTLAPGTYTVTASRGFEYELDTQTITLAAGDTKALSFSLKHSVDTTGYMCGDFHLHAMWSPDSSDLYDFKVASFAAGGLELAVATDHEYITDYTPFIKTLGLERWVFGIIGEELTTFAYGHFNPYPITIDTTQPNNGAVLWWDRSPPQLFDDVRARWPSAIFQINHPRSAP
ncbi:MAG: carboxypeptidase regulatory-like domain-containing protein, partial [Deltaproteobacteria bacterium]|nr:carboxypeptidase regulatory-like domain-containing protein [Deltaproteobacteria bacterium]